jgi:hypothetical protein
MKCSFNIYCNFDESVFNRNFTIIIIRTQALHPMKLSKFKEALRSVDTIRFQTPDGDDVPGHFHITEAGLTTKHFIDCGGTVRKESSVSMQLWTAEDYDHRLSAEKLLGILEKADPLLGSSDLDVEIEYQSDTIGRYSVEFEKSGFQLVSTQTDCLAKDACGITPSVVELQSDDVEQPASVCTPGSGCC